MLYCAYLFLLINSWFHTQIYPVQIGDTTLQIIKQSGSGKTLIHLHENEKTALQAAKLYVDFKGGSLITLRHGGDRNIQFYLKGCRYEFDPNRIFTDVGIEKTLKQYGPYTQEAHAEVKKFAAKLTSLLTTDKIIAVHNNSDYSIQEYFPFRPLQNDAACINFRHNSNYRNFYFVTRNDVYCRLKKADFNVALQAKAAQDDGSLSYFLADKNYINIEAGHGEISEQLRMIFNA